ncbi:MAG TPA: sugar ABC transporter permease [Thermomicrobiales bacterium]|jgi:multiple sugar transport system permease protein|nr:sugar ABC transporter permease [Thermomicrobiales bacterium]
MAAHPSESVINPVTPGRPAPATGTRARRRSPLPSSWLGYLFILPNLLGFAIFTLLPLAFAFAVSFANWDVISGIDGIEWIGFGNFSDLLRDGNFWGSLKNTAVYVGFSVPLTTLAGMGVAIALNGPIPGRTILRLIFFIPFITNTVAIGAVWLLLYHPRYSPLNNGLRNLGVEDPPAWLASSTWAMPALIIIAVWAGAGYAAIIYLAALQDISPDLYEAANLDGATSWERFRSITFPLLTPTTFFLLVTGFIGASQSFGLINLMTEGGPGRATTVLSYYIYQNGFEFYRFGYAAALSWVMFAGVLLLTLFLWRVQRRMVHYE